MSSHIMQKQQYQMAVQDFGGLKLPRLGRKKRYIHSKNPYKVKQILIPDDDQKPKKRLDGFLLLKVTKNDLPHEIIKADLSKMNIVETIIEDTKYFINLSDLDLSENEINLEDLVYFQNLVDLKLVSNKIEMIKLPEESCFQKLQSLDLSFNYIVPAGIDSLSQLQNLKYLNLENNELRELPEEMSKFQSLEELNLNNNLFESDSYAASFWYTLSGIRKLKTLLISRNQLRGIHTEKLVAGNFLNLNNLDFSYNIVENQHNLICARNFRKLQKLVVTGNPFAILQEHKGLEMEVYARTGAELINDGIERPYLKKERNADKYKITFENIRTVENDNFGRDKNYFMGIEMPKDLQMDQEVEEEQADPQVESQINEQINEQMQLSEDEGQQLQQEEQDPEDEDNNVMFMTEDPNQRAERLKQGSKQGNNNSKQQLQNSQQGGSQLYQRQQQQNNSSSIPQQYQQYQQESQLSNINSSMNNEEFLRIASQNLGDVKEYEHPYELNTAYKTLKNVSKRPDDYEYQDYEQPNYMKQTKSIKRYISRESASDLLNAGSFEKMDSKLENSKIQNNNNNGSKSIKNNNNNQNSQQSLEQDN